MNKKYLFFINLSMGLTLAIQALLHPTLESQAKTSFIIVAVVFINWAMFTWLAYSVAMKENSFPFVAKNSQNIPINSTKQDWKSLLDVTTITYQIVILLSLIFLNILLLLQITDTSYLVGTILVAIILPLLIALFTNYRLNQA
jgi:hypothetical protein